MSSNVVRWSGVSARGPAHPRTVLTLPFALAYGLAFGAYADFPFWSEPVEALYPLDFSYGERVNYIYGRLYFLTLLPELFALHALRRLRGRESGSLETWGFRRSLLCMWMAVIVATFPVMFLLIYHVPSGPLLTFHAIWVTLGYVLWSGQGILADQLSRVR